MMTSDRLTTDHDHDTSYVEGKKLWPVTTLFFVFILASHVGSQKTNHWPGICKNG